jgi:hypothetical protein
LLAGMTQARYGCSAMPRSRQAPRHNPQAGKGALYPSLMT